ncbi:4-fold beta flower protein [Salinarimonas sp.]|uniref:4-fold beta flower protein n=1 Tax=Salinarimonas sp. TaxID=2766526 RepID=UPI0032D8F572
MDFFDRDGRALVYSPDGTHLHTWDGDPVGYLHEGKIFDFSGKHRGWFESGWLLNKYGERIAFTRDATGGPIMPLTSLPPLKGLRGLLPLKGLRELPQLKPLPSSQWGRAWF